MDEKMTVPEWADAALSEGLLVLVAQGEGQALEFMVAFPEQVRELAKEIAAFATSNAGTILLGVNDAGDIVGLVGVVDAKGRDALIRRIEGICSGSVKPAITPTARWAIVDRRTVLALSVPKGRQPVYYAGNIPYLRHITQARPAEPHEVLELVRESVSVLVLPPSGERDAVGVLLSTLTPVVVDILIYCDEAESRLINPWFDLWRAQFNQFATDLQEIAATETAIAKGFSDELKELANALDEFANAPVFIGSGPDLLKRIAKVRERADGFKHAHLDPIELSPESVPHTVAEISQALRSLSALVERSDRMLEQGRAEELQAQASRIGHVLLRTSYYEIVGSVEARTMLRDAGRELHLVETMRMYLDGGVSENALKQTLASNLTTLKGVSRHLSNSPH